MTNAEKEMYETSLKEIENQLYMYYPGGRRSWVIYTKPQIKHLIKKYKELQKVYGHWVPFAHQTLSQYKKSRVIEIKRVLK